MRFACRPTDLSFIDAAPTRLVTRVESTASPERLFDVLLRGEGQTSWARGFRSIDWHGSMLRDVHLDWISVRERFLALEPPARFCFAVDAMSVPIVTRMVEDIRFTRTATGAVIDWVVSYDLRAWLRPFARPLRAHFAKVFEGYAVGLARYGER